MSVSPVADGAAAEALTLPALLAALDAAEIGYAVVDLDGAYVEVSAAYRRIASLSEARVAARTVWYRSDHAGEDEFAERGALWRRFLASGNPWRGWVRWHLPSGRVRYFEGTARRIGEDRVILIGNDRSDRIEADRALEESETMHQRILDDLPVAVALQDPTGRLLYVNDYLPRRLGLDKHGAIGLHPSQLPFEFDAQVERMIGRALREGTKIEGEAVRVRVGPLKGTLWAFYGTPLRDRNGEVAQYLSIAVDRTDAAALADARVDFARAVAETQKVGALNDFAGALAHELSNVLHPVGVYARQLSRNPDHSDREAFAAKIEAAAMTAGRILKRTLGMARSDEAPKTSADLGLLVADIVEGARDLAPRTLSYEVAPCPVSLRGAVQVTEFRQVMLNLLNNAAEAMHYTGTITVAVDGPVPAPPDPRVTPLSPGPFLRVAIRDEGTGMTDEVAARIFEPFFTSKEAGRGTGLGLPVALGLVTGWGGTLDVDTAPGEGSTFTLWIPAA